MASNKENEKVLRLEFTNTVDAMKALRVRLEEMAAKAIAAGDEVELASIRGQQAGLAGSQVSREAAQIDAATAALAREKAAAAQVEEVSLANLETLKAQTKERAEQVALAAELQRPVAASEAGAIVRPASSGTYAAGAQRARLITELQAEAAERERLLQLAAEQLRIDEERVVAAIEERKQLAYDTGFAAGAGGTLVPQSERQKLTGAPSGVTAEQWLATDAAATKLKTTLGEYDGFATRTSLSTEALTANLTRLGLADAQASNQLRKHGALTTEFLSALARGETTVSEFGYQIGATIGKFAGWTAAATATYTALGAVVAIGKGAIDAASGVQQLTRTIDNLDREKASTAIQDLSQQTNVPLKEASDAIFAFSRTFHNVGDAAHAAGLALSAYKLDGVQVADTVKAATALHQQFGLSAQQLTPIFDQLAQGQQKFNARISDQIPLLQKSASAVKNAGGNLRDFIEISTIFLRTTQLSGTQGGTAFARSSANFLNPDTSKGQADRAVLQTLGINPNQNYTQLIFDALRKSPQMTDDQRRQLGLAIFGPQLGARTAGFFTGGAALLPPVQRELSPAGAKGTLQVELAKQLASASEELHSFVNALERIGAAVADSGALTVFGVALKVIVGALDGIRGVIDAFDQLPKASKEVISALLEVRLAMLLLNRTGFGRSIPGSRFARIPGIDPTFAEQNQRGDLTIGTRNALKAVDDNLAQTTAQITQNGARQLTLKERNLAIEAEIKKTGDAEGALTKESVANSAEIVNLQKEQTRLEAERNAQVAAQATLQEQIVSLTSKGNKRLKAQGLNTLNSRVNADAQAPTIAATDAETAAADAQSAESGAEAEALTRNTAAQGRVGAARAKLAAAFRLNTVATAEASTALAEETVAADTMVAEAGAVEEETVASTGVLARMGGGLTAMAASFDPLLAAILVLPLAYESIKNAADKSGQATAAATAAANQTRTSLTGLQQQAADLHAAALKQDQSHISHGPLSIIEEAAYGYGKLFGIKSLAGLTGDFQGAQATQGLSNQLKALGDLFTHSAQTFQADTAALTQTRSAREKLAQAAAKELTQLSALKDQGLSPDALVNTTSLFQPETKFLIDTTAGRKQLAAQVARLKAGFQSVLSNSGLPQGEISGLYKAFSDKLQSELSSALLKAPILGSDPFAALEQETPKAIEQEVQRLSDYAKVFGTNNDAIQRAAYAYTYLANKFGGSSNDADLQAIATAQSNFISAATKNVADLLHASEGATTLGAESGDISGALGVIAKVKQHEQTALDAIIKKDAGNAKAIALAKQAADQIFAQLNDQLQTALTDQLALIQAASDLKVSQITGISPESDIQRAQVALTGLQAQLVKAQADHASYKTVTDLQTKINDAQNALLKQQISNADSLAQAQGQLAVSSIAGVSPEADLQRAAQAVTNARNKLARDQASGAGQEAIATDMAGLDDALHALNQQQISYADSIAQAQGQLSIAEVKGNSPKADVERARRTVVEARQKLARDKANNAGEAAILTDQAGLDDALNALNNLIQSNAQALHQSAAAYIASQAALSESQTLDPVRQAQEQLAADTKTIATIQRKDFKSRQDYLTALNNQRAKVNTDAQGVQDAIVQQDLSTLAFESHTQQIGDSAYISGLEQILANKKLSLAERQQIESQIYDLQHATSAVGALDINVGNISLPSVYEIRRAIAGVGGQSSLQGAVVNHTATVNVYVNRASDASAVGQVLDDQLGTSVRSAMRSAGVI